MTDARTTSAAKLAVAVRGLREKSPELELAGSEPLAIIGIGCRFAGDVIDPDGLWNLLRERRNVAGGIPADRFTREDLHGSNALAAFDYCRGAFLRDIDRFDAHCEHLVVRENHADRIVGTYRILTPDVARTIGGYYSEGEFRINRLHNLRGRMVEVGRSCIHPNYRRALHPRFGTVQLIPDNNKNFLL